MNTNRYHSTHHRGVKQMKRKQASTLKIMTRILSAVVIIIAVLGNAYAAEIVNEQNAQTNVVLMTAKAVKEVQAQAKEQVTLRVMCITTSTDIEKLETETWFATTDLNIRSGPGTEYNVIECFSYGDEIQVTREINSGWVQVKFATEDQLQLGYVSKKYIVQNKEELNTVSNGQLEGYTDDDVYLLAQVLTCEAGTESRHQEYVYEDGALTEVPLHKAEMARVCQVVINRINSSNFPNSLESVVSARGQYPWTWRKIRQGKKPTADAIETAENILNGHWVPYFGEGQDKLYSTVYQGASGKPGKGETYVSSIHEYRYE